ncbi:HAD-IA family hydrolase [Micromonospora phytophila]|uniref:HAD-IA family hydrolase n=1 Tax=Micromonospora phytophila TaxID=709888 RepID=UPI00203088A6|nr:HAD-IA family hydrolase [Micromonospora phytophila]MCM0675093.1 HAD-IA family hydrolase [Micromonospora phytophila]
MDRPVLFDIDGTLVDSTQAVTTIWREVASRYGVDAEPILKVCHGRRDEDVVPEFFSPDLVASVVREIADLELLHADLVEPIRGAASVLNSITEDRWAVVTSGSRALMTARMRGAGLKIPTVFVAADDVSQGKPHPEGYLLAASQLGVDAMSCVVVEDSPAGVAAGKAAGAAVVALAGTHTPESLTTADVVIENLNELARAIKSLPA